MTDIVKRVQFLYFDAGGGHRAAATALKSVVETQNHLWEITLVNVQELLHSLDIFRKLTGIRLEDIYNLMLARGWTLGAATGLKFMHGVIRTYHHPTVRLLTRHFSDCRPDLVVSLIPNFNRAISQSLHAAAPTTPIATIITDFADYPPHFWIEPARPETPDRYIVCGTDRAVEQARSFGYSDRQIFRASGMILRPRFYEPVDDNRAEQRKRLGLDPSRPVALVLFGGQGSKAMLDIARRLEETQLILICGRNEKLASALRALPARSARHIEGFTQQIPYFMHLADFFIGKPGPGSISEALSMKLPVIVESNAWTLPQERYNAQWVRERGVGIVLPHFRDIAGAVQQMLGSLEQYRARVASIENRAVFEIPEFLDRLLH
ncbi:MAG TPA: glycosyltransferase [Bryobacteraceae bacterium]|nr:glycosyltransferase [Bryobacteraceae bacterium]